MEDFNLYYVNNAKYNYIEVEIFLSQDKANTAYKKISEVLKDKYNYLEIFSSRDKANTAYNKTSEVLERLGREIKLLWQEDLDDPETLHRLRMADVVYLSVETLAQLPQLNNSPSPKDRLSALMNGF